ncbi:MULTISPECIES: ectoine/hydroxyectoine ABC transporter permease subunit EhuD [Saccharothrix]|uniref:ectoine/hydroxyectoine ABC transporter permease subunit EhuD n=1 Tax=Saccharothrix TaxID=2071 RepID=UPI00093A3C8D|nr:ectoine/hydroxyectoine ABC transporter permease subunit EhuD [Saccharothrix sp. CB00851]OKI32002.1 ectoine/hydroxyectoine ABC transporter permease subunit EhuD [Saccharothrix sp. CB00851]
MTFDWQAAWDAVPSLLRGLVTALHSAAFGYLIALVLGLVFALLRRSPRRLVRVPVAFFVEFVRSTPLLVQLFFLFFVLPTVGVELSAMATGAIGLGVHYATYTSEVYRAGIDGVPAGQWEAAKALSLSRGRTWTRVVLPQAVPRVVPALGNYAIALFKDTPQLTVITIAEVLSVVKAVGSQNFQYLELITVAGVLYLITALVIAWPVRLLERRHRRDIA